MTPIDTRRRHLLGAAAAGVALGGPAPRGAAAEPTATETATAAATERLHALFDDRWEWLMRRWPTWASELGDARYGDRWPEISPAAEAADAAARRETLARARAIPREALSPTDQVSLDIFVFDLEDEQRYEPDVGFRSLSLGSNFGFQSEFARLLESSPTATRADAEQILARMAGYPRRVVQELAQLREGLRLGWVPPPEVLDRVVAQIDGQLAPAPDAGPFFTPFTRLGTAIPPADQEALRGRARAAIAADVLPPLRALRAFVVDEYRPAAPASGALGSYPDGPAVYARLVASRTTTELTPAQVHALGERELARLVAAIDAVRRELGLDADLAAMVRRLNGDLALFHAGPDAMLAGYREIAKRIDPELPKLFARLPRAPYGVRAMPAWLGAERAETYDPPALDGSRAGWFNANVQAYRTRPIWAMETLVAHETVPGHHLQAARAVELGELPKFRRNAFYGAYVEGWAVYAETLGFDLGLYREPASRFGHLQWQAIRAARLVVDTGLHAFGWSRQRAIDCLVDRTGLDRGFAESEVDRYVSDPGQALGYTIGALKIAELRDHARARLGARFDLRRFHSAVLDQGAVPLPVLERTIDAWIAGGGAAPTG